jgi:hypothetical protein|tara:strand:+ start:67 stop:219 length:153 start_codon:yes stop_codon:yes gene_type:complete
MEKFKGWALFAVVFYFTVNGIANHPKEIRKFRREMNSVVNTVIERVKRVF